MERGLTPSCDCNNTFYDDGVNADCVTCPSPGGVCGNTDSSVYITCASTFYMIDGESGPECLACPSHCNNCYNDKFCYECSSSDNRGDAPWCACATGYYHDGVNCTSCPTPSTICYSETSFSACIDTYYVEGDTCLPCSYPCINCLVDFTCTLCGYDVEHRKPTPECTCIVGYYD